MAGTTARRVGGLFLFRLGHMAAVATLGLVILNLMGPSTYSHYAYYTSIMAVAVQLSGFGLDSGMQRYLLLYRNLGQGGRIRHLLVFYLRAWLAAYGLAAFVVALLYMIWPPVFASYWFFALVVGGVMVGRGLTTSVANVHYVREEYALSAMYTVTEALLLVALVPGLFVLRGLEGAFGGYLVAAALVALAALLVALGRIRGWEKGDINGDVDASTLPLREIVTFGVPLYLEGAFNKLGGNLGTIALSALLGRGVLSAGFFNLALSLTNVAGLLTTVIPYATYPELTRAHDSLDTRRLGRLLGEQTRLLSLVFVWGFYAVMLFGREAIGLIFPQYVEAYPLVVIMFSSLIIQAVDTPYSQLITVYHLPHLSLERSLLHGFSYSVLYPVLIGQAQSIGAATAYLVSLGLASTYTMSRLWARTGVPPFGRHVALVVFSSPILLGALWGEHGVRLALFAVATGVWLGLLGLLGAVSLNDLRRLRRVA